MVELERQLVDLVAGDDQAELAGEAGDQCPNETTVGPRGEGADIVGCEPGPAPVGGRGDASDVYGLTVPVERDRTFATRPVAGELAGDDGPPTRDECGADDRGGAR